MALITKDSGYQVYRSLISLVDYTLVKPLKFLKKMISKTWYFLFIQEFEL
ncbi:MAG: hypothetical protein ACXAC7_21560 [Candidatus Hodarchaeales archaeon]